MAVIDATFIFGHLSDHQNAQFAAAVPASGLPQLQIATLGRASCDFGDFFAAALVGAILARERRDQLLAAAAVFVATLAFDQLFLVVDGLPATVPPAVVMLACDAAAIHRSLGGSSSRTSRAMTVSTATATASSSASATKSTQSLFPRSRRTTAPTIVSVAATKATSSLMPQSSDARASRAIVRTGETWVDMPVSRAIDRSAVGRAEQSAARSMA
jgi:hypothetical protein